MSVQVEQISPFQKRLQFSIPSEEVSTKVADAFKTVSQRVRLPGFRPGKAPRKVLEARFGSQIRSDVAADIINFKFREAVQDIPYLGQPEVDKGDLVDGADFTFTVTVQVKPEIVVEGYRGIGVDFPVAEVSDTAVEARVQARLVGHAKVVEVTEDRAIRSGDLVITEITALLEDGEHLLEGGTMVNTTRDRYYPGVEALLVGKRKDEVATGTITLGENAALPARRGQAVEVRVRALGIQSSEVPALTDELATELGYEGGVEAMRAALRMEEEAKATEAARNQARVDLLQKLIAANPIDVPPAMVDSHAAMLKEELRIQAAYRGRDPRSIRYSQAQEADLRERGRFAARSALLLDAVARAEGIAVTDADLEAKYQEIADLRGQRVEAIRGYFKKDNAVEELRKRLLEERTLEWLLEQAELNYVTPPSAAPAADPVASDVTEAAPAVEPAAAPAASEPAPVAAAAEEAAAEPVEAPKKKRKSKKAEAAE